VKRGSAENGLRKYPVGRRGTEGGSREGIIFVIDRTRKKGGLALEPSLGQKTYKIEPNRKSQSTALTGGRRWLAAKERGGYSLRKKFKTLPG